MGATSGAGITYSSGEPGVTPLSSYMICHRICNTGATSGADITYSSGEPGVSLGFLWGSCCSRYMSEYDEERFVDTKGVTCSRNSRGRQPNGKKKKDHMTNNNIPNTTLKTKY